ncbi:MAG: peroxiredoxin-like family protein, partial [Dehalococcoidia bacterium]
MEQITPETAALSVLAPSGDAVRLDSLWAERPALLVLVRHFGCQFCREQLADLRDTFPQVEAAGVQPAVIGNGTPLMAQAFLQETGVEAPLYTDPPREVYRALGTKRPSARVFLQPRQWWYFIRAAARGYFPKAKPQGDPAQLG